MYKKVTICEMVRQVNDICQDRDDVRALLKPIYKAAKKMNDRLNYYAKKYEKKKKWDIKWEDNPHKKKVIKLRNSKNYKGLE